MLIALAVALAPAQASSAPGRPALSPALVQELVDAMPNVESDSRAEEAKELARLVDLNPGHETELRGIVRTYFVCLNPQAEAAARRMFADMAYRLGSDDKVRSLLRLFRNDADLDSFDRLSSLSDQGEPLTDAQSRELDRLMNQYPLADMAVAMKGAVEAAGRDDTFLAAVARCSSAKKAALARSKLRPS